MLISGYVLFRSPLSLSLPDKWVGRHYLGQFGHWAPKLKICTHMCGRKILIIYKLMVATVQ